jgi:hypothetical protein
VNSSTYSKKPYERDRTKRSDLTSVMTLIFGYRVATRMAPPVARAGVELVVHTGSIGEKSSGRAVGGLPCGWKELRQIIAQ